MQATSKGSYQTTRMCRLVRAFAGHTYNIDGNLILRLRYYHITPLKVSKGAKIRNRYNQVPHLTQKTKGKVTNSQLDTTNGSQEVSPFQAGNHKAHINRHAQKHSKRKTEKHKKKSTKEVPPWNGQ